MLPTLSEEYLKNCRRYKHKVPKRDRQLLYQYGIREADYDFMFEYQGGCCGICKTHQSKLTKRLAIDHCHETGRIRGLLCGKCNTAIGLLKDSMESLARAYRWVMTDKDLEAENVASK